MTLKSPLYLQTSIFQSITRREDSKDDFFIESLTPKGYLIFFRKKCDEFKHCQYGWESTWDISYIIELARLEKLKLPTRCLEGILS